MKTVTVILIIFASFISFSAQSQIIVRKTESNEPYYKNQWHFGFTLMTGMNNNLVRFGFVKIHEDGRKEYTWLSQKRFIMQAAGFESSKANKDTLNLFEKYEVDPGLLDHLWKLRYQEYPFDVKENKETGWAAKQFVPGDKQWAYLKQNFNFGSLTEFCYGENFWRLLKSIQDPDFINHYSSLK